MRSGERRKAAISVHDAVQKLVSLLVLPSQTRRNVDAAAAVLRATGILVFVLPDEWLSGSLCMCLCSMPMLFIVA